MQKRLSVAMAVCNGEKYLPCQIDSILSQLGPEDELVVSYDPSEDETLRVVTEYARKDGRVRVIMNDSPGVTGNFSSAIAACSGDYVFLSDQDDRWLPGKVSGVMDCFSKTGADLVIHNGIHTDADLNPAGEPFFRIYRIGDGVLRNIIRPRMSGCCMAFSAEMKEKILPIPEIYGYDQWIALICECCGHVEYLDEVMILHRLHGGNVTPRSSRPLLTVLRLRMKLVNNLCLRLMEIRWRKR